MRDRQRETDRDRQRETDSERQTDRERERQTDRDRQTDRQTDRDQVDLCIAGAQLLEQSGARVKLAYSSVVALEPYNHLTHTHLYTKTITDLPNISN